MGAACYQFAYTYKSRTLVLHNDGHVNKYALFSFCGATLCRLIIFSRDFTLSTRQSVGYFGITFKLPPSQQKKKKTLSCPWSRPTVMLVPWNFLVYKRGRSGLFPLPLLAGCQHCEGSLKHHFLGTLGKDMHNGKPNNT